MSAIHLKTLQKRLDTFKAWLSEHGASVLQPTNEWEVVRFLAGDETAVIYTNKTGRLSYVGQAEKALQAFMCGHGWRAETATKRTRTSPVIAAIRHRDGNKCFFCLCEVKREDESAEHLVPVTHRGPNHISNLVLAHKACNQKAGHLSAAEKIRVHVNASASSLLDALRDCVMVMERELGGLLVIQPELRQAREALAQANGVQV